MKRGLSNRKYKPGDIKGPYTIIGYSDKKGWITCKCNICGSIHDVTSSNVAKNKICKDCKSSYFTKARQNLVGRTFGRLTVIEPTFDKKGRSAWLCMCDCGNYTITTTGHLNSGHTQSCGCYMRDRTSEANSHDLTGQVFGKLTVIEKTEGHTTSGGNRLTEYICKCSCGNYLPVLATNLVNKNTRSCGCLGPSVGEYEVELLLKDNNLDFSREFGFDDLRSSNGGRLRFDFAIFDENDDIKCLIEYNGEQHYYNEERSTKFGKQQRTETDAKKKEYCNNHNIPLFEIRFDEDTTTAVNKIIEYCRNT